MRIAGANAVVRSKNDFSSPNLASVRPASAPSGPHPKPTSHLYLTDYLCVQVFYVGLRWRSPGVLLSACGASGGEEEKKAEGASSLTVTLVTAQPQGLARSVLVSGPVSA